MTQVHDSAGVRPLRCRVVREPGAAAVVSPLNEADAAVRALDSAAYGNTREALFVYRLRRGGDEHTGVVGDVPVEAFVGGRVRGHESVQPQRVAALVHHFAATPARSEPVALLHRADPEACRVVAETSGLEPLVRFTGPDGIEHTVWEVPAGEATDRLATALGASVHYIADGHHRVAANLRAWRSAGQPPGTGLLCVIYPMDGLRLAAFHRRVTGPVDAAHLLDRLAEGFTVRPVDDPPPPHGCFGLYLDGRWYDVALVGARPPGAAGLDVAILQDRVLGPVLGIVPVADPRLVVAPASTPLAELTGRVDEDRGALFTLRPPALDDLVAVADRGEVMMPKTTYFEPKPYAGIFLC
ncbi:MAG TPA: DUF1015 family protein [Nocardioidaceae bacterium]|nr:DUF1015 family protein [Nocardioidaceae bacterium]